MSVQIFFVVVTTLLCEAGDSGKETNLIAPDPEIQSRIERTVEVAIKPNSTNLEQLIEVEKQLRNLREKNPETLVKQLLYYYSRNQHDEKRAITAMVILAYFRVSPSDIVPAVVPYICTDNRPIRREVRRLLRHIDGSRGLSSRAPDYSYYRSPIERNRENPPLQLVRYMYERSPGTALLILLDIYRSDIHKRNPQRSRELLKEVRWAEHIVADALWKHNYEYVDKKDTEADAANQLDKLSKSPHWWIRLYVAEIMRQHEAFRQLVIIERLKKDEHPLVRKTIEAFAEATDVPGETKKQNAE